MEIFLPTKPTYSHFPELFYHRTNLASVQCICLRVSLLEIVFSVAIRQFLSTFVDSINVFECRISGVVSFILESIGNRRMAEKGLPPPPPPLGNFAAYVLRGVCL